MHYRFAFSLLLSTVLCTLLSLVLKRAPKKPGGMRPIRDLLMLNRHIAQHLFHMLTVRQLLRCIQPGDWMTFIDFKDTQEVSTLRSRAGYLSVLLHPVQLLAGAMHSKCVERVFSPLRERGVRILTYVDYWLILAC